MPLTSAKTIYQQIFEATEPLYGDREANSLATAYLFDRWHIDRIKLSMNLELAVDERMLKSDLRKLQQGMPLQHVVGFQEFFGHKFQTNHHALIPRPETEELVEWVIESISDLHPELDSGSTLNLLDIGTGTGCIPICLDLAYDHITCHGIDVSKEALTLADRNAKRLGSNASFGELNILNESLEAQSFEIIVSNPPYIPERDKAQMHKNVLDFEPGLALFVSNEDPLIFYRIIAQKAAKALKSEGLLFLEIHEAFGEKVMDLMRKEGFKAIELRQDINGKDRMIKASKI